MSRRLSSRLVALETEIAQYSSPPRVSRSDPANTRPAWSIRSSKLTASKVYPNNPHMHRVAIVQTAIGISKPFPRIDRAPSKCGHLFEPILEIDTRQSQASYLENLVQTLSEHSDASLSTIYTVKTRIPNRPETESPRLDASFIRLISDGNIHPTDRFHLVFKSTWTLKLKEGQRFYVRLTTRHKRKSSPGQTTESRTVSADNLAGESPSPDAGFEKRVYEKALHPNPALHYVLVRSCQDSLTVANAEEILFTLAVTAFQCSDARPLHVNPLEDVNVKFGENLPEKTSSPFVNSNLTMSRSQYDRIKAAGLSRTTKMPKRTAYIALGSNVGDSVQNIELACRKLNELGIEVNRTSSLYLSQPMYYEDQAAFVNGVCEVYTTLEPSELLLQLQKIERELGRIKFIENGPRTIDLDIVLYDDRTLETENLCVPHKKMLEREFVIRPLCDIIPDASAPNQDPRDFFRDRLQHFDTYSDCFTPLALGRPGSTSIESQRPDRSTNTMIVVNLTPDSFSDGGLHDSQEPSEWISSLRNSIDKSNPYRIIDLGGQSTRPHAPQVPPEEELSRILPALRALRQDQAFSNMAISVDTYRASVARAAMDAGADIINDVSAGQLDPQMLPTIAELGCTCILMHMRGTPETMNKLTDYPEGIIHGVATELLARVDAAQKAGIRRWRIILDPGIGFAKTQAQNLELLRRFDELRNFEGLQGFPWAVGVSRKSFIGKITGVEEASARQFGTAACVTAAVRGGADIVRVHDVEEMTQVVKMADSIWRVVPDQAAEKKVKNLKSLDYNDHDLDHDDDDGSD